MTARQFTIVVLRILGLLYLTWAFSGIVRIIGLFAIRADSNFVDTGQVNLAATAILVYTTVMAAFGVACLFKTAVLSRWLFPECRDVPVAASVRSLQTLGFAVVGVALAAYWSPRALADLIDIVWNLGAPRRDMFAAVIGERWLSYVRDVGGLVIGAGIYESSSWLAARLASGDDGETS